MSVICRYEQDEHGNDKPPTYWRLEMEAGVEVTWVWIGRIERATHGERGFMHSIAAYLDLNEANLDARILVEEENGV